MSVEQVAEGQVGRSSAPSYGRARRKPSPRNVQIYEAVRLAGERQADVAARHGLSQRRVSAICTQVDQWQRWASMAPNLEELEAQQRRTAVLQARQRSERLLLTALKQAARKHERLVSEERRIVRGQEVVERSVLELPIDPAWLKLAGWASRDILRFTERLGPDVEPSQTLAEVDKLLAALGAEEEGESGRESEGESNLLHESRSEPDEGANYSSCSKAYGVSGPNGAPISAASVVENRCADESCGDISGGERGENRGEKKVRFIASKVFCDANPEDVEDDRGFRRRRGSTLSATFAQSAVPPPLGAPEQRQDPPVTQLPSDSQSRLPREVRERRAKFLRG